MKKSKIVFFIVCSVLLSAMNCCYYKLYSSAFGIVILLFSFAILCLSNIIIVNFYIQPIENKKSALNTPPTEKWRSFPPYSRIILFIAFLSCIASFAQISGHKISLFQKPYFPDYSLFDLFGFITTLVSIFIVVFSLYVFLDKKNDLFCKSAISFKKIKWYHFSIILFIWWVLWFLVYYPGGVCVDTITSIKQAGGVIPLQNDNPLLFTISLIPFVSFGNIIGNINIGVALYIVVQMTILSVIIGYCITFISNKCHSRFSAIIVALFYLLNPILAVYSVNMSKDTPFSVFVLCLSLLLYKIIETNGEFLKIRKNRLLLFLLSFLVAFSRVNGFLVLLFSMVGLIVYLSKKHIKYLGYILMVIVFGFIQYGPIYSLLGVNTERAATEAFGVQLQQICYTVVENGEINDEEKKYIENSIMSFEHIKEEYTPYSADGIKFSKYYQTKIINNNKTDFLIHWFNIMKNNKLLYLKAHLMETIGYYYIMPTMGPGPYGTSENDLGIISENPLDNIFGFHVQEAVNWIYARIVRMCSIGVIVWIMLISLFFVLINKKYSSILPFLPALGIWIPLLIGAPIYCEFRYMFPCFIMLPILVILGVNSFKNKSKNHAQQKT